jgi:6-phosphogluconate dehydrogenase
MQLGMIGLGRMGANLVRRLVAGGHTCVVFDVDPSVAEALAAEHDGITAASTLAQLADGLELPRAVWIMVPAAVVQPVLNDLVPHLNAGDAVIDGGNSSWHDDVDRSAGLASSGIDYLDIGTSGGVHGLERGYCLMIGGPDEAVARLAHLFETLAPGVEAAERSPGRDGAPTPAEQGWLHCGPSGAGHFVKMVHNGIEYALMAAYAEGLNLLRHAGAGLDEREVDAETTPLRNPQYYRYDIDTAEVAEVWRRGSVVSSWLLDLTAAALAADPQLDAFSGNVSDSGEGRWTAAAAIDVSAPTPVLTTALYSRFSSRGEGVFGDKLLSAMRAQFGGHHEKPA